MTSLELVVDAVEIKRSKAGSFQEARQDKNWKLQVGPIMLFFKSTSDIERLQEACRDALAQIEAFNTHYHNDAEAIAKFPVRWYRDTFPEQIPLQDYEEIVRNTQALVQARIEVAK